MAEAFKDYPGRAREHRADRRTLQRPARQGENYLPDFDVPPRFTVDSYFEHVAREGFAAPAAAPAAAARRRALLRHTIDEYERRLTTNSR